eukprot:gene1420-1441_t
MSGTAVPVPTPGLRATANSQPLAGLPSDEMKVEPRLRDVNDGVGVGLWGCGLVPLMNISISLTPELVGLIKAKVETGRYTSTSEVVREALRMLERADQREQEEVARLRAAWQVGIASGSAGDLDFEAIKTGVTGSLDFLITAEQGLLDIWQHVSEHHPDSADRLLDRLRRAHGS